MAAVQTRSERALNKVAIAAVMAGTTDRWALSLAKNSPRSRNG